MSAVPLPADSATSVMATPTVIEAHALDSDTGAWCDVCHAPTAVSVQVAVVDGTTLAMIGRYTSTRCVVCGAEELTR